MDLSGAYGYRLDWIVSFVAVVREGGFSAAARAQFRSQPRISSHVSELERTLGTKLFDRSVHPATLTPEGRALLPHAEEILARLGVFADVVAEASGQPRGEVHVGMYPSAAAYLYPALVQQLRQEAPEVTTVLREGDTLALEGLLVEGDIDVAVRPMLPLVRDDRLGYRRLWREPLVAVLPESHPLGDGPVTLSSLIGLPLITIGEPTGNTRQFETNLAFAEAGTQPRIAFQTNQPQTMASLVRAGLGIGVTNALAMMVADCAGLVLATVVTVTAVERQVAVWWRSDRAPSAAAHRVVDVIERLSPTAIDAGGDLTSRTTQA